MPPVHGRAAHLRAKCIITRPRGSRAVITASVQSTCLRLIAAHGVRQASAKPYQQSYRGTNIRARQILPGIFRLRCRYSGTFLLVQRVAVLLRAEYSSLVPLLVGPNTQLYADGRLPRHSTYWRVYGVAGARSYAGAKVTAAAKPAAKASGVICAACASFAAMAASCRSCCSRRIIYLRAT